MKSKFLVAAAVLLASIAACGLSTAVAQTADSNAPSSLPGDLVYNLGWNNVTSSWDRVRTGGSTDNSSTTPNTGITKNQMFIYNGSAGNLVAMSSASASLDTNALANGVPAGIYNWNGTSWDRHRSNFETASASLITLATTSANGTDQINYNGRGLKCVYDVTSLTGTNTILTIQGKDSASGKYYTLLASAAIVGVSTTVLTVHPGLSATANVSANDVPPRIWRVITTNTAVTVFTGTVGCTTIN